MQAKKTSSIPESCGSKGSSWLHETDFMKSTGGNLFTFSNDAKEEGAISGRTRLKSAVTCLCTLADPVWRRLKRSKTSPLCCDKYCRPIVDPERARTMDSISKQYASEGICDGLIRGETFSFLEAGDVAEDCPERKVCTDPPDPDAAGGEQRSDSHSSRTRSASTRIA